MDFIRDEPGKLVVAYEGACVIFDAETGAAVSRLEGNGTVGVNRVVAHPILPMVIAAYEDRHIRFFDHRSATLTHAMVAHLDAVTSLAVDPQGLYLLSGSEFVTRIDIKRTRTVRVIDAFPFFQNFKSVLPFFRW